MVQTVQQHPANSLCVVMTTETTDKSHFQEWFIDYYCAMTANTSDQPCLKNMDQIEQSGAYKACAHLLQWLDVPSTTQNNCSDDGKNCHATSDDKRALARYLISNTGNPFFRESDETYLAIAEATAAIESAPYNSIARRAAESRRALLYAKRDVEMAPLREKYNATFDPMWKKIALFEQAQGLRFAGK